VPSKPTRGHKDDNWKSKQRLQEGQLSPGSYTLETTCDRAAKTSTDIWLGAGGPVIFFDLRHTPTAVKHTKKLIF
tara:strand:+ start:120 stop:344 length:225 start_codon:yes stop_codon:yes gene_type:complete